MKQIKTHVTAIAVAALAMVASADNIAPKLTAYNEHPSPENLAARELFQRRGFGLFIHYGLYSVSGFGEWQLFQDSLDAKQYYAERLPHFKPKAGCVDEWIKLAKDAGMRYIVLTTRHHEGYWLGDDFIREYTTKVRAAGLGVGVYYSVADWSDPGFRAGNAKDPVGWKKFVDHAHADLRHLMTDFGKIEYLFYDGCPPPLEWDIAGINAEMRRLQPHLLICRGHVDCDFKSCEGNSNFDGAPLWEACYTFNHSWGYNKLDVAFKPLPDTIYMFYAMRHNGGNFLLNVGPMADGTVQKEAVERLRAIGKWVKQNEEAIFDVVPHPFSYAPRDLLVGGIANKGVAYWMSDHVRVRDGRVINGISNTVTRVTYLDSGEDIPFTQDRSGLTPRLILHKMRPATKDDIPYIVKIAFEGAPKGIFNERLPSYAGNDKARTIAKIAQTCTIKGEDTFYGHDRVRFDFQGHEAWVVFPKDVPIKGKPWTWCMQWATAFVPRTNVPQMLDAGYHHVTIDTFSHHMDAEGIRISAAFQKFLVDELGFAPKANLIGMSWGGFFSIRYAAAHPENVRKIYLDAPLLTFTPGRVDGVGTWKNQLPKDGNWLSNPEMPVNKTEAIAKAGIPVLLLYGGQDQTVPPATSAELFEKRFRAAGGSIKVVKRYAFGHHPHGIEESETTIKDFFEAEDEKPLLNAPDVQGKAEGRLDLPRIHLDKEIGANAYYRLAFTAKSMVDGYWWVDFYDKDGKLLPDVNSRLHASQDWQNYDVMVPASPEAAEAVVAFVAKKEFSVKNITLRKATLDEAVEWCSDTYSKLPRLDYIVAKDCWEKLPNAKIGLKVAKNFNVVLLGDSIMNDSYCGLMTAIAQKAFPDTKIRFDISVRGSTGCWYYREKEHFEEYVAKYRPNLVLIGGISNCRGQDAKSIREAEDAMVETIRRCQAIGAEVVICTPAPSCEFRKDATATPFDRSLLKEGTDAKYFEQNYERRAAERTGAQVWDLTIGPSEAIARSGKPLNWFKRDFVHNDNRGKQLIAQMFGEYFRAAYR